MKKHIAICIFFALFILAASSCKKDQTNQESPALYSTTVTYQFTVSSIAATSYSAAYTSSDGTTVVQPITLTTLSQPWSSSVISVADTRVLKSVTLKVSCATITTPTTVVVNILASGSTIPVSTTTYIFTSTSHDGSTTYTF